MAAIAKAKPSCIVRLKTPLAIFVAITNETADRGQIR
jgi:hypothetical protein